MNWEERFNGILQTLCYLINSHEIPQYTMTFFITLQFLCPMTSTQTIKFTSLFYFQ